MRFFYRRYVDRKQIKQFLEAIQSDSDVTHVMQFIDYRSIVVSIGLCLLCERDSYVFGYFATNDI